MDAVRRRPITKVFGAAFELGRSNGEISPPRSTHSSRLPASSNASAAAAQLDLVEFTPLEAYARADRLNDAHRMLSVRRRGSLRIPVAGFVDRLPNARGAG